MRKYWLMLISLLAMNGLSAQPGPAGTRPVIVEVIAKQNEALQPVRLKGLGVTDIKQWYNRLIVYAKSKSPDELKATIASKYPDDKVLLFDHPFYDFNRSYCTDKNTAKQWDNIIMSANLVQDPKMQQEYLNYHYTQFQRWPEVSQGFCNARFQQLLVFKNGRQLMLVISIPKGESLDRLNPLTTKNNPRVDEWNRIMKNYQEGIGGTKPGEIWVEFKDVVN